MVPVDVDGQICHFCSQGFVPWRLDVDNCMCWRDFNMVILRQTYLVRRGRTPDQTHSVPGTYSAFSSRRSIITSLPHSSTKTNLSAHFGLFCPIIASQRATVSDRIHLEITKETFKTSRLTVSPLLCQYWNTTCLSSCFLTFSAKILGILNLPWKPRNAYIWRKKIW